MRSPTWVLGYHGCDRDVGEAVLAGENVLHASENEWDWLGTGIYFWENSPQRAFDWAKTVQAHPQYSKMPVKAPFVVGAVIDLGNCLDLLEAASIRAVKETYEDLRELFETLGSPLPVNGGTEPDRAIRRLDCVVINYVHATQARDGKPAFDSVRAAFVEGEPIYDGAAFNSRTHIQLCVRKESQVIGYFRVRDSEITSEFQSSKDKRAGRRASSRKGG